MIYSETVSVICICYNHAPWIVECLESVRLQNYSSKELFVVDNGSTDNSLEVIEKWINESSGSIPVELISISESRPYPQVFNEILAKTKGQFIIDLSGDDVLYPEHFFISVSMLKKSPEAAFVFSDAYILDDEEVVKTFYKRKTGGELIEVIETSKIYETLVRSYSICSPTVVFNRPILVKEGGYDEQLSYEDFDIQIRMARKYPLLFSDHVGVLKREHDDSMSSHQYQAYNSKMLPSTLIVCRKIKEMNETEDENAALKTRVLYELKHALWSANFEVAKGFIDLGVEIGIKNPIFLVYKIWASLKLDISWLYTHVA